MGCIILRLTQTGIDLQRVIPITAVIFLSLSWLSACSGSGGGEPAPVQDLATEETLVEPEPSVEPVEEPGDDTSIDDPNEGLTIEDPVSSEIEPAALGLLREDSRLISSVPEVVFTQTLADSGLQITYVSLDLVTVAPADNIEEQWFFMEDCLEQVTNPPVILVREGPAVPFTIDDDVVRNEQFDAFEITSIPVASATMLYGSVLQISDADFDGSIGTAGFNLRSIMGRHLWLSAGLAERDYPFSCAQQQP